ncbi:MAG TPA: bifunctional pyr operon transcriptional regulator/uracil phosphoribosyltransferase PyrR [Gammaproteobacteria bacterium]|nr:bifunctional pyr operon transcriptional regulator/uracil phosphoribosyltransferase PyrR [Gammaproteobacteria bacterium]
MNLDAPQLVHKLNKAVTVLLAERQISDPLLIGIRTGGVWLAESLHKHLNCKSPLGKLDISFYRDDFSRIGLHPQVKPSHIPTSLENRDVILIDDVLQTGRTIRAALNEIFDYGRPNCVILAVLVERNGRELPIQADVVGAHLSLQSDQTVELSGPSPLELTIKKRQGSETQ